MADKMYTTSDIAKEMGLTRQGVDNLWKKTFSKMFSQFRRMYMDMDAYEVFTEVMYPGLVEYAGLNMELDEFYKKMPDNVKAKIDKAAKERLK